MSREAQNTKAFEDLIKVAAHGGAPAVDVPETFTLAKLTPLSQEWYFSATCADCGNITPAFRDASQGHLPNYFAQCSQMHLHLRCRVCQCHIDVPAKALRTVCWE